MVRRAHDRQLHLVGTGYRPAVGLGPGPARTNRPDDIPGASIPKSGAVLGNVDLSNLKIVLGTTKAADGTTLQNAILYGSFISTLIDFVIIMAVVFVLIKIFAKDTLDK